MTSLLDHTASFLRQHGQPVGLTVLGGSLASWVMDHSMDLLGAIGIVVSIVIQILTYRLKRREVESRMGGRP